MATAVAQSSSSGASARARLQDRNTVAIAERDGDAPILEHEELRGRTFERRHRELDAVVDVEGVNRGVVLVRHVGQRDAVLLRERDRAALSDRADARRAAARTLPRAAARRRRRLDRAGLYRRCRHALCGDTGLCRRGVVHRRRRAAARCGGRERAQKK